MKKTRWHAFVALLMLCAIAPTHAATFGRTQPGTLASDGLTGNFKRATRFTLSASGTVTELCAYLDGGGATGNQYQSVRFALYADANGVPGAKLTESGGDIIVARYDAAHWECAETKGWIPLSAGNYWLAIHSDAPTGLVRYYYDGPSNWYGNADPYSDGASNPYGAGEKRPGTISIYAVYTPQAQLHHAGRTAAAPSQSSGLRAEYKRGSSFSLTEAGRVNAITMYLDGKGGASGAQSVGFGLYADAGGAPGSLVTYWWIYEPIQAGMPGQWLTAKVPPTVLAPGRYWLIIYSGGTAGVARYYADGAGNWYGSPANPIEPFSKQFGAGSAGDGTLSAFISYEPGQFVSHSFGASSVGSALEPVKGDYLRGSRFTLTESNASITSINVYADGKGGAAGSQQFRFVIYSDDPVSHQPRNGVVGSEPFTIAAGKAAGWVKVPVFLPAKAAPGSYWIMLHSGGTPGVARLYGTGSGNWLGSTKTFSEGEDEPFNPSGQVVDQGTTTLSFSATYAVPQH
jgi:hypothetical protein